MEATFRPGDGIDERDIVGAFTRAGLRPRRWSNGAGEVYGAHEHAYHKVLYCLRGTIMFTMTATAQEITLRPGDRLDIPPQTMHSAVVGAEGCDCIEAADYADE